MKRWILFYSCIFFIPSPLLFAQSFKVLEFDRNGDGRTDTWRYQNRGAQYAFKVEMDRNYDGTREITMWYNEATGVLQKQTQDRNKDSRPDTWSFFEGSQKQPNLVHVDSDYDGRVDLWRYYQGTQHTLVREEYDTNRDRRVDKVIHYGKKSVGAYAKSLEWDTNHDRRMDVWQENYETTGLPKIRKEDRNFDGTPDSTFYYHPQQPFAHRAELDSDFNGSIDNWKTFDQKSGKILSQTFDTDRNNIPEKKELFRKGRSFPYEIQRDSDQNRQFDTITRVDDRTGGFIEQRQDINNNGRIEKRITFHPGTKEPKKVEFDEDEDGTYEKVQYFKPGAVYAYKEMEISKYPGRPPKVRYFDESGRIKTSGAELNLR